MSAHMHSDVIPRTADIKTFKCIQFTRKETPNYGLGGKEKRLEMRGQPPDPKTCLQTTHRVHNSTNKSSHSVSLFVDERMRLRVWVPQQRGCVGIKLLIQEFCLIFQTCVNRVSASKYSRRQVLQSHLP